MIANRFEYVAEYTGDGKRGRLRDTQSDFVAYVDRDDCWTEGVDLIANAIAKVLNESQIPNPDYSDEDA